MPRHWLLAVVALAGCGSSPEPSGDGHGGSGVLVVSVIGGDRTDGDLCIALFGSAAGFPDDGARALVRTCHPFADQPIVLEGLVEGHAYAVSAFHDLNRNGLLDTRSFVGVAVPDEPYGFSNDPPQGVGAPGWEDAQFTLADGRHELTIALGSF